MRKVVVPAIAAVLLAGGLAAPVAASDTVRTTVVERGKLDPEQLEARIVRAAEKVCDRPFIRNLRAMGEFNTCVADASSEALAKANVAIARAETNRS